MTILISLISTGAITIPILLLTVFEAAALLIYHNRTGNGPNWRQLVPNILAGDCLLLAWLTSATHQSWAITGTCLAAGFAAHLTDLVWRWDRV